MSHTMPKTARKSCSVKIFKADISFEFFFTNVTNDFVGSAEPAVVFIHFGRITRDRRRSVPWPRRPKGPHRSSEASHRTQGHLFPTITVGQKKSSLFSPNYITRRFIVTEGEIKYPAVDGQGSEQFSGVSESHQGFNGVMILGLSRNRVKQEWRRG